MNRDTEYTACRECGRLFELTAQPYYDNRCPPCVAEEDPERTWQSCWVCDEKINPDDLTTKRVRGAARDPATVPVPIHKGCR